MIQLLSTDNPHSSTQYSSFIDKCGFLTEKPARSSAIQVYWPMTSDDELGSPSDKPGVSIYCPLGLQYTASNTVLAPARNKKFEMNTKKKLAMPCDATTHYWMNLLAGFLLFYIHISGCCRTQLHNVHIYFNNSRTSSSHVCLSMDVTVLFYFITTVTTGDMNNHFCNYESTAVSPEGTYLWYPWRCTMWPGRADARGVALFVWVVPALKPGRGLWRK